VIDVNRLLALLLGIALILGTFATACSERFRRPVDGDPDEYQSKQIHSETSLRPPSRGGCRVSESRLIEKSEVSSLEVDPRPGLVIDFPGKLFVLEE